jgi:hypothetical protein
MMEGISSRNAFLITLKAQQLADSEFKFFTAEEEAKLLHDIPILIEEGMSPEAAMQYAVLVLDVNAGENIVWDISIPEYCQYKNASIYTFSFIGTSNIIVTRYSFAYLPILSPSIV